MFVRELVEGQELEKVLLVRASELRSKRDGAEFLRLSLNAALQHGLQPIRLVHALQNHDEMTYELVHFAIGHNDDIFRFRGAELTGGELALKIRSELVERLTGEAAPYNATFTTNGIASTTATIVAAALGYIWFALRRQDPPLGGGTDI